ncbi:MAG: mannose-6-phosphate isomerase, class I [Ilumatobacteraceae bacterium]
MSPEPRRIVGPVQHYAWGDPTFIPTLQGREPDGRPWAEWWLGTHPNGPASFADGTELRSVTGDLPYLLKVLAAAEPLSLQAHPTAGQAVDGHRRGVYPDANAKPELLCALTRFEALCGMRPADKTIALLRDLGADATADLVEREGPGAVLRALYRGEVAPTEVIDACCGSERPAAVWVNRLHDRYPDDPSVAATILLNHVVLAPGEAIHLTAGNLHAYLHGAGIELMGASDNVVRGGLTVKPVDVDELLRVVDATPLPQPIMIEAASSGRYPLPEAGCTLVRLDAGAAHTSSGNELAVGLDGTAWYVPAGATLTPTAPTYIVVSD